MYINHTLLNTNTIMFSLRRSFVINHYIITLVMNILLILCISHNWGKVFIEPNGTPKQSECTLSSRLCVKVATTMPVNHMKAHSCSTPRRLRAPNDNNIVRNWLDSVKKHTPKRVAQLENCSFDQKPCLHRQPKACKASEKHKKLQKRNRWISPCKHASHLLTWLKRMLLKCVAILNAMHY